MQGRSRMAALMLVVVAASVGFALGDSASFAAGPAPVKQQVKLNIRLDGTTPNSGVELVIKPGHPACRFKTVVYPVKRDDNIQDIPPIEVETFSADRDCSFAIILKQPGQADKVFRRILQINPSNEATASKTQTLQCYLSSRTVGGGTASTPSAVATKPATDPARSR